MENYIIKKEIKLKKNICRSCIEKENKILWTVWLTCLSVWQIPNFSCLKSLWFRNRNHAEKEWLWKGKKKLIGGEFCRDSPHKPLNESLLSPAQRFRRLIQYYADRNSKKKTTLHFGRMSTPPQGRLNFHQEPAFSAGEWFHPDGLKLGWK